MAKAPLHLMTKKEILALHHWRCRHGHGGIQHYNCYLAAEGRKERVGFLDIEASNLKADFGIMLTWCIKVEDEDTIYYDAITPDDLKGTLDKRIIDSLVEAMRDFDRIVTHYGSRFDIPFVRTRAIVHGLDFPQYKELMQSDTWRMARRLLALSNNRQDTVARALLGETVKTRIESKYWLRALQGDKKAIAYILEHNEMDVLDLERNYKKLAPYFPRSATSV